MVTTQSGIIFFFFNDTATTEIYTLSLHDALPISERRRREGPADLDGGGPCGPARPSVQSGAGRGGQAPRERHLAVGPRQGAEAAEADRAVQPLRGHDLGAGPAAGSGPRLRLRGGEGAG